MFFLKFVRCLKKVNFDLFVLGIEYENIVLIFEDFLMIFWVVSLILIDKMEIFREEENYDVMNVENKMISLNVIS